MTRKETIINPSKMKIKAVSQHTEECNDIDLYKSIFNSLADSVFIHDLEGNILEVNDTACKKLGYTKEELLSIDPNLIYSTNEHISIPIEEILEGLKSGEMVFEILHTHKSGKEFNMEVHNTLYNYKGQEAILSLSRDITERKQIENSLKLEGEKLKGIINNSPALIYLKDEKSNYLFLNEQFKKHYPDVTGKTDYELFKTSIAANVRNNDRKVLSKGTVVVSEEKIQKNGEANTYYSIKFPVKDNKGRSKFICGISLDITHLKKSEEILKKSEKELSKLNKIKNQILSIITHDVRKPFHQMIGLSELVYEDYDNYNKQELKDILKTIYTEAQYTNTLLNNLLEWSNLQDQNVKTKQERFELTATIFDILLQYENLILDKGIKIQNMIPKDVQLFADKHMIQIVLTNLIENCIKHNPDESLIQISHLRNKKDIEIIIKDNGTGIDSKILDEILNPKQSQYFRNSKTSSGSGLGFFITKELIQKHHGQFLIESQINKGSTFTISIPNKKA
ncbi:MAG: PAS domain S-box protein [Bacteroidales bacterium]|nr:PAS domain S-box protein [Bacteroidales bacterium]